MKIRFIFPLIALLAIAGCTKASTDPSSPDPEIPEDPVRLICKVPWEPYPKIVHNLNMKNDWSDTPLS